jgi:hypothetical protein
VPLVGERVAAGMAKHVRIRSTLCGRLLDALIDRYCPNPSDRLIAASILSRFENSPYADRFVEPLLAEAMAINARALAGELSPVQARELLMSTAESGFGLPPHLLSDVEAAFNDTLGAVGGEETEPQADVAAGPRAELIRKLFAPEDRAAAEALAKALDADPRSASRTEALLHEVAQTTDMTPEAAYSYIADFARSIGIPEHLVTSALHTIGAPAQRAHEEQTFNELVGDLSPQHRAALSDAERRQAREEADQYERMMRENPSEYWKPQNQEAYRQALERSIAVPVPVAPAAPADGGPAAPAATPPLTQPAPSSG